MNTTTIAATLQSIILTSSRCVPSAIQIARGVEARLTLSAFALADKHEPFSAKRIATSDMPWSAVATAIGDAWNAGGNTGGSAARRPPAACSMASSTTDSRVAHEAPGCDRSASKRAHATSPLHVHAVHEARAVSRRSVAPLRTRSGMDLDAFDGLPQRPVHDAALLAALARGRAARTGSTRTHLGVALKNNIGYIRAG